MNAEISSHFRTSFHRLKDALQRVIVGQNDVIEGVLVAFFADGHVLLEGAPGLGKTALVRALAGAVDLQFSRVQFTPDLMPADIVGTSIIREDSTGRRVFEFQPGPIFTNLLLADEINRATPKTQSALLEAMQEHQVTAGGETRPMKRPFLVLATQNPLEMEGTYPLPEAQLDRFFFKLKVGYPSADELHQIVDRTTTATAPQIERVMSADDLAPLRDLVREVPLSRDVQDRAVQLVLATHPESDQGVPLAKRFVRYGASPRGVQALILAGKIYALLDGRYHVAKADVDRAALAALRHRLILNFEGEAEGVTAEKVIGEALAR